MSQSDHNGSANGNGNVNGIAGKFSLREIELLGFAMQCLKSGPPEVDYDKLAEKAGMTNVKSAANAWGKIRAKLNDGVAAKLPPTPKGTPKKGGRGKTKVKAEAASGDEAEKNGDGDDEEPKTPKKTPRKRVAKANDEEGSPKKRTRKPVAKKGAAAKGDGEEKKETAAPAVKPEPTDDDEPMPEAEGDSQPKSDDNSLPVSSDNEDNDDLAV